jgi:transcriptional regulator with XRE-family HTH domain
LDAKKVGKSIAFLRNYYGLTQKNIADYLGVTDKAVSRWERGLGTPDISLLTKLSIILDTDIESILEGNLTNLELKWKGVLNLNYSNGINAQTLLFDKHCVCYQISFFMLAGINDICVRGDKSNVSFTKEHMGDGSDLGIHISYEQTDELGLEDTLNCEGLKKFHDDNHHGIMLVDGLDFIYGKDLTKYFRRIIYNERHPQQIVNFKGMPTSIYFYPYMPDFQKCFSHKNESIGKLIMERGLISFPLKTMSDVLDAATIIRILETHNSEEIADLGEIAVNRGFINPIT